MSTIKNNKGKDLTISWSGYETFIDCPRKWYYGYMDRIRTSSQATEVGSNVHDMAEAYLKGELDLNDPEVTSSRWFRILLPGLVYAPTPEEIEAEGWGVEDWVKMPCGPLPFVGKLDFYNIEKRKVCDWKTTGFNDFRYSKSPSALAKHGQPLVYTYALFHENPPETVDFQHINLLTKGKPGAMESWAYEVPWSAAVEMWQEVEKVAVQMAAVATNHPTADTVTAQTGACRKFGGCPHAEYCLASPQNFNKNPTPRQEPLMANAPGTNDRLARLRARLGVKASPPAPPEPSAPEPAPPEPSAPEKRDPAVALAEAVEKVKPLLDSLGSVPEAAFETVAEQEGVLPFQLMEALNLRLVDGSFVLKLSKVHLEPGMPVRDAEAAVLKAGLKLSEQLKTNQLKTQGGILVPASFAGGVTEAYQKYRPGTAEASAAQAIEKVEQTSPPPAENANTLAANHLIQKLTEHGKPQYKTKANDWVKEVLDLKRIRQNRWDDIISASSGRLAFDGGMLHLVGGWADELHAAEPDITELVEKYPEAAVKDLMSQLAEVEQAEVIKVEPESKLVGFVVGRCPEIFVDAFPLNDDYMDFSEWIHPWELEVAAENGVPYYGLVGYGQGSKQVVSKVIAAAHARGIDALPDCTMVIDSFHPLAAEVIPVLNRISGVRWVKGRR